MAVKPRGAGFQADVQWKGQRHRETFTTHAEAAEWERVARDALRRGKPLPERKAPTGAYETIASLIAAVRSSNWDHKPGAHALIVYARRFEEFVGKDTPTAEALTQENVDAFVEEMVDTRAISGSTVNRHLTAISVLVKRAISARKLAAKLDLSWRKEGQHRLRYFSDDEEALILQTLRLWSEPRFADFFIVLLDTGARTWKELGRLQWRDVTSKPRMITFWDTKNGDSRAIPLTVRAYDAINRQRPYDAGSKEGGPFRSLSKDEGRRLWDRLRGHLPGLQDTVWYTARHTFASRLVQNGVDLYRVSKLMGHRSITTTQRYAKLAPTHLVDAIGTLEPHIRKVVDNG